MRSDDDSITSLDSKHSVAHGSNNGIGGRSNSGNNAHGLCNLNDTLFRITVNDADTLAMLHIVPDNTCLAHIFGNLVFVYAHAGFVYSHSGQ